MNAIDTLVTSYLAIFNTTNPAARRALVDSVFAESCEYTDPLAQVAGRAAVSDFIGAVQAQFPGVAFVLDGKVDAHHGQARFTWRAMAEGVDEPVAIGFDVVVVDANRLSRVYGFLDKAPGAA